MAWGKLAELCSQLLKKGSKVFVSGRLQYNEWETQDGQKRRDAEIVLEDMIVLTSKSGTYGEGAEGIPVASEPAVKKETVEATEKAEEGEEKEKQPPKADEKLSDKDIQDLPF